MSSSSSSSPSPSGASLYSPSPERSARATEASEQASASPFEMAAGTGPAVEQLLVEMVQKQIALIEKQNKTLELQNQHLKHIEQHSNCSSEKLSIMEIRQCAQFGEGTDSSRFLDLWCRGQSATWTRAQEADIFQRVLESGSVQSIEYNEIFAEKDTRRMECFLSMWYSTAIEGNPEQWNFHSPEYAELGTLAARMPSFRRRMLTRAMTEGGEPLRAKLLEAMGEMPQGLELLCEIAAPLGTRSEVLEPRQGRSRGAKPDEDMEPDRSPEAKWEELPDQIKIWFKRVWAKVDVKANSLAARVSKTVVHYIEVREDPTNDENSQDDDDDDDIADDDDDDEDDDGMFRQERAEKYAFVRRFEFENQAAARDHKQEGMQWQAEHDNMTEFVLENDKAVIGVEAQYKVCKLKESELKAEMTSETKAELKAELKAEQGQQGDQKQQEEAGPSSERGTSSWGAEDLEHLEAPGDVEMHGE